MVAVTIGALAPNAQAADSVFYVDPATQAAVWVAANPNDSKMPVIRDRIATVPQGRWFTQYNPSTVRGQVDSYLAGSAAAGKIPIMVIYEMPNATAAAPAPAAHPTTRPGGRGSTRSRSASTVARRTSSSNRTCCRS
jgi:hypothetical protein